MSMYLPNPDVHPTGWEPAEFIEAEPAEPRRSGGPGEPRPHDPTTVDAGVVATRRARP